MTSLSLSKSLLVIPQSAQGRVPGGFSLPHSLRGPPLRTLAPCKDHSKALPHNFSRLAGRQQHVLRLVPRASHDSNYNSNQGSENRTSSAPKGVTIQISPAPAMEKVRSPSDSLPESNREQKRKPLRPIRLLKARVHLARKYVQSLTAESLTLSLLSLVNRLRWIILGAGVLLFAALKLRNPAPQPPAHVRYSTFLAAVAQGDVTSVRLEPGSTRVWFSRSSLGPEQTLIQQQTSQQPSLQASNPMSRPHNSRLHTAAQPALIAGQAPSTIAAEDPAESEVTAPSQLIPQESALAEVKPDIPLTRAKLLTDAALESRHSCWREQSLGAVPASRFLLKPCPEPQYQFVCHRLTQDDGFLLNLLYATGTPFTAVPRPASEKLSAMLLEAGLLWLALMPLMAMALRTISGRGGTSWRPFNKGGRKKKGGKGVGFDDVAGVDVAKAELMELVRCLQARNSGAQSRSVMSSLGAQLPRGVLLVGPPGTGKTLLARALAWEAGVPFFSASGSEFVEMFVGRGAARVRELFAAARRAAPAVVFIDEIDAVGSMRGRGNNEEREQTLNQLLTELDGFDTQEDGVLLLAATNRLDVLDPALCRAGRISRRVLVPLPDEQGRRDILMVHLRDRAVQGGEKGREIASLAISRITPGFSGAELQNVVNEASLLAIRQGVDEISPTLLQEAVFRSRFGVGLTQGSGAVANLVRWLQSSTSKEKKPSWNQGS